MQEDSVCDSELLHSTDGAKGMIDGHLYLHGCLKVSVTYSQYAFSSCPELTMSGYGCSQSPRPRLVKHTHRLLCPSLSSDSNGRFKALQSQEWKNKLKAQMEKAHSVGSASSTGSLERTSVFCDGSIKSRSGRFAHFFPPWNSSSESDSTPPSRLGSRKAQRECDECPHRDADKAFRYSEPLISKVTDFIYVGNVASAYSGQTLCRNSIDSVIDMSAQTEDSTRRLIPCTCSRGARHTWSRLKVDIGDASPPRRCFDDINECMEASAQKGKRVLVHCSDGFSLAPTCVIQYLMVRHNMPLLAAYELVRAKHPVNIGEKHRDVLVHLESSLRPAGKVDPECFKQAISRKVAWS